jgi:Tfp pilus assembly protein PilX
MKSTGMIVFYVAAAVAAALCFWIISERKGAEDLERAEAALKEREHQIVMKRYNEGRAIDASAYDRNDKSTDADRREMDARSRDEYITSMRSNTLAMIDVAEKKALAEARGDSERASIRLIHEQKRSVARSQTSF